MMRRQDNDGAMQYVAGKDEKTEGIKAGIGKN
jgi:hypothetical protein